MDNMFEKEQLNSLVNSCQEEIRRLKKQNDSLKQKLNWIAFGDEPELALRYLREIGYVDFDEERKVYINKHNNEPFFLKDEQEKYYYIKDNELNEYTEQLKYQIKELKKQLTTYQIWYRDCKVDNLKNISKIEEMETQQKEFIEYMNKTRTIIIDGIEIQTSLTGVEIAGLVQRNKELEQQCKKQKEVIDRLNFIKNRKNQGASQENINKMAIEFVNSYLKEVSE